jgi:hypothetical protein
VLLPVALSVCDAVAVAVASDMVLQAGGKGVFLQGLKPTPPDCCTFYNYPFIRTKQFT